MKTLALLGLAAVSLTGNIYLLNQNDALATEEKNQRYEEFIRKHLDRANDYYTLVLADTQYRAVYHKDCCAFDWSIEVPKGHQKPFLQWMEAAKYSLSVKSDQRVLSAWGWYPFVNVQSGSGPRYVEDDNGEEVMHMYYYRKEREN